MTLGERAALEGVVAKARPRLAIEIGTAEGGSLRRIAEHSEEVHSFDLVEPHEAIRALPNVELHIGDSHALLPAFLDELARDGRNVDFAMVDGDHSADGVRQDMEHLLASDALRRSVILIHDTCNDEVRRGLLAGQLESVPKVRYVDLDFVAGHLSHGDPYHHQLWGGLGVALVNADEDGDEGVPAPYGFYDMFDLLGAAREAVVAREDGAAPVPPHDESPRRLRERAASVLRRRG